MINKSNTKKFIEKSNLIHNFRYDYSLVNYINSSTHVIIICKEHGEFNQKPNNHITGDGCRECFVKSITKINDVQLFINLANKKYNRRYDYSKVVKFKNKKSKIIIICPAHKEFKQSVDNHLTGVYGCRLCAVLNFNKNKIKGLDYFLKKATLKHGSKYNYSKVSFRVLNDVITITCPKHNDFTQKAQSHLNYGCINCYRESLQNDLNNVVARMKIIHNNIYDYSNIKKYEGNKSVISIKCKKHGYFKSTFNRHLNGNGCSKCSKEEYNLKLFNKFVNKSNIIHYHKFIYIYSDNFSKSNQAYINCPEHGKLKVLKYNHSEGSDCFKCVKFNRRLTKEGVLNKAIEVHGYKYNYDKVEFNYVSDKIIINCINHGDFKQRVGAHIYAKHGCPNCCKSISKQETKWLDYLNIPNNLRNKRLKVRDKSYFPDAFDPNTNTIYEFLGDYWHGNLNIYKSNDINKLNKQTFQSLYDETMIRDNQLRSDGYTMVTIWESDWNKIKCQKD